jgi:hypothetical protein
MLTASLAASTAAIAAATAVLLLLCCGGERRRCCENLIAPRFLAQPTDDMTLKRKEKKLFGPVRLTHLLGRDKIFFLVRKNSLRL